MDDDVAGLTPAASAGEPSIGAMTVSLPSRMSTWMPMPSNEPRRSVSLTSRVAPASDRPCTGRRPRRPSPWSRRRSASDGRWRRGCRTRARRRSQASQNTLNRCCSSLWTVWASPSPARRHRPLDRLEDGGQRSLPVPPRRPAEQVAAEERHAESEHCQRSRRGGDDVGETGGGECTVRRTRILPARQPGMDYRDGNSRPTRER